VEDIWGDTAGQQALFGVLALGAAALLFFRMAVWVGDGILSKYVRYVAAPCTAVLGVVALVTAAV
jgi:hypothetical protein